MENMVSRCFWLVTVLAVFKGQAQGQIQLTPVTSGCSGISRGTHFIVGFTDNYEDQYTPSRELFILVVAFNNNQEATQVTISSKHQVGGHSFTDTFMVNPGGFKKVKVPVELTMNGTERSFKTIDIRASSYVSAYGLMYQDFSTDAFLGVPTSHLGMQYVVVTPRLDILGPVHFAVIGTEDSTHVQVTLQGPATFEGASYSRGDVLSFMVDFQEAVQIQAANDLTGSIIQADKPIAVFSGSDCERNPRSACDTLTEQLVPVRSWGQEHIYTASNSTDNNQYFIVSYFPGTVVSIPNHAIQTLDAGESWEGVLPGSGLVTSSNPILVMQQLATINGVTVDPSLIQVPAVEQFEHTFGFTTPPYSGGDAGGYFNFITIVVKKDSRQTVYLNNATINEIDSVSVVEHDVPETDYISITIQVPKGEGVYYVDSQSSPVSVIVYGYERAETYGYAAGLSLSSNEQHLSFTPYFLRELGGERLSITVPCRQQTNSVHVGPKCKFSTGVGDVKIDGYQTNSQSTLYCITPAFYKNGLTAVYVSLDNGRTFPYSGVVYIPSEEDLPPLVTAQQLNSEAGSRIIDLKSADPILLSWDPTLVGGSDSYVTLMGQDSGYNKSHGYPVLMEGIVITSKVINNGTLYIPSQDLNTFISPLNNEPSLVAFYITKHTQRRRRDTAMKLRIYSGVMHLINNSVSNIPCSLFNHQLDNVTSGLNPCPCTSDQANVDSLNFVEANFLNSFFHPGAKNCFRSTTSSSTGSGQQCCYDDNGDILVGPPGGGTADRYGPGDHFWFHQWYDVLPWLGCCNLSNNCDEYYDKRPSDDCSEYVPPRPGGGVGDPHITSLDGKRFTFNGAGEFLMASSTLHNLTFQARMEVYRDTNASVYTAVVIQTNDSSKVQVQMSNMNETMILVDGETILQSSSIRVQHHKGIRISFNRDLSEIRIAFNAGVAVIVYIKPEVMSFIAQLDTKFKGQVKGLLGNMNEDPDDDFQFPNGFSLNTNASLYEVHEFGLQWLLAEEDSIFTYISPYDYKTYYFPEFSPNLVTPDPNLITQEIKDLCGESFECIFDATTTGSLSFANETLLVTGTLETIQKSSIKIVSCGFPGKVENGKILGSIYFEDSTLEVTCDVGFNQQGSASLWCQGNGQWSSNLPQCVVESKQINIVLVLLIALAVFATIVLLIGIHCTAMKKSKPAKPE